MEVFAVLQSYIPFLPEGAEPINDHVAIYRCNDRIEFFTASGPIYSCREDDPYGLRLAQGIIVTQTSTKACDIARALKVNRTTVYRNLTKFQQDGPIGLIIDRKSNRSAYKLNGKVRREVQKLLDRGCSLKAAAKQVGITEGCIRYAISKGTIIRRSHQDSKPDLKLKSSSERSTEDNS